MGEPGGDGRFRRFALDQRRAERRVSMGPADQHRQLEPVTPRSMRAGKKPSNLRGLVPDHTKSAPASRPKTLAASSAKAGS